MDFRLGYLGGYCDTYSMNNNKPEPLAVRVEQAAELLGLSRPKVYQLTDEGRLDFLKIDAARRIPMDSLREFIERHRVAARYE